MAATRPWVICHRRGEEGGSFFYPGGGRELLYGQRCGVYVDPSALGAFPLPKGTPNVFLAYVDPCGLGVCVYAEMECVDLGC